MKRTKNPLANEKGFTLIEIIAVLIILGILAAVAVPKYMDLTDEAEKKAVNGAVAELNGRANLALAQWMLDNSKTVSPGSTDFSTDLGGDFNLTATNSITFVDSGNAYTLTYSAPVTTSIDAATPANWEKF